MEFNEIKRKAIEAMSERLDKKNIKINTDLIMIHLIEEFGEIASQINNVKLKRKEINIKNIGEEISDCIILLMRLSKEYNIDLEKELLEKIEDVKRK